MKIIMMTAILFLSGCQAMIYGTAADFNKLSLGMTKVQVISILGTPVSTSANAKTEEETLIYKRMKHAISEWPRTYEVTLRQGKVIRYGEQYQEKNVDVY